jgi:cysteine-rich repeat protein/predicted outer membrane repeat protein
MARRCAWLASVLAPWLLGSSLGCQGDDTVTPIDDGTSGPPSTSDGPLDPDTTGGGTTTGTAPDSSGSSSEASGSSSEASGSSSEASSDEGSTGALPDCGNGILEGDEECDEGEANDDSAMCTSTCALARCGDGLVGPGEGCDDGDGVNWNECTNACALPTCGDDLLSQGEECDEGEDNAEDAACLPTCVAASCGDGLVWAGMEQCDDGNAVDEDACTNACEDAACGDGIVWDGVEACDDGNVSNGDACPSCQPASCGDGFVQAGVEQCDDGNAVETDACLPSCIAATCGDGFVQAGVEICDDGNLTNGDGCESNCTVTPDPCGPPGQVIYVDVDAVGANNGTSWANAFNSVFFAMLSAGPNDELWVAEGEYLPVGANGPVLGLETCVDVHGGFVGGELALEDRPDPLAPTVFQGDLLGDDVAMGYADNSLHVVVATDVTNAVLDGVTITGGRATGAGDAARGGGLLATNSSFVLTDVGFLGNVALVYGGGLYGETSNLMLVDGLFGGNGGGTTWGGAVALSYGSLVVDDTTFVDNAASVGGAVSLFQSTGEFDGDTFDGNSGAGGAIHSDGAELTVTASTFVGNSGFRGGAILADHVGFVSGSLYISDSTFDSNTATNAGGAIWADDPVTMNGVIASNNQALDGGALFASFGDVVITGGELVANEALGSGGAMFLQYTHIEANGVVFDGNTTTDPSTSLGGGAIRSDTTELVLTGCSFIGNGSAASGGAIWATEGESISDDGITIDASLFDTNTAGHQGGALRLESIDAVTISSTFVGNTSASSGGAIRQQFASHAFDDVQFLDNQAGGSGGALFTSAVTTITGSTFAGNTATTGGGAHVAASSTSIDDSVFTGNTATSNAGGLFLGSSVATVTNTAFVDNGATGVGASGGGVFVDFGPTTFGSCTFAGNTATAQGGAMFSDDRTSIINSTFRQNSAGTTGGALHALTINAHPHIASSTFYQNSAVTSGGGIELQNGGGIAVMRNVVMWGNGVDVTGIGNVDVTYTCSEDFISLGAGNSFAIPDPIVLGPSGELFLEPASMCVDEGSDAATTANYTTIGLDWQMLTTQASGVLDASPVDMGMHYQP